MMKREFSQYIESIDIGDKIAERIEVILSEYQLLKEMEVKDIFISEYQNDDGQREYENLWLFTEKFAMEAKNFIHTDNYDFAIFKNSILYLEFNKIHFNLNESFRDSRFSVDGQTIDSIRFGLKSSGVNCEKLLKISKAFLIPNIIDR